MKIYVKKLWSLSPDKYKFIPLNIALKQYYEWSNHCAETNERLYKYFELWLKTEI